MSYTISRPRPLFSLPKSNLCKNKMGGGGARVFKAKRCMRWTLGAITQRRHGLDMMPTSRSPLSLQEEEELEEEAEKGGCLLHATALSDAIAIAHGQVCLRAVILCEIFTQDGFLRYFITTKCTHNPASKYRDKRQCPGICSKEYPCVVKSILVQ